MSHVLLWQPSECVHLIVNCVMLFSENKYDDDDMLARYMLSSCASLSVRSSSACHKSVSIWFCFNTIR